MIKNLLRTFSEIIFLSIIFLLFWKFFALLDPREMMDYAVFPWDSGIYKELADNFYRGNYSNLSAMYPFGYRILFPLLYANLAKLTGYSLIESAYIINLISAYVWMVLTYYLWKKFNLSIILRWVGIGLIMASGLGPLRYAGIYPGGGFAFEMLLVILLFLLMSTLSSKKIYMISAGFVCLLSFAREFITYILLLTFFMTAVANKIYKIKFYKNSLLSRYLKDAFNIPFWRLGVLLGFSLVGYLGSRFIVADSYGQYSLIKTIFSFGWFHLHIGEFLYPFFYALGPFFLSFLTVLIFSKTRLELIEKLCNSNINLGVYFPFIVAGCIFMIIGGTDSDRFLLWFFPFYGFLGLLAVDVLWKQNNKKLNYSVGLILIVGLLWTRFYVPAIPHLFFPGDTYRSFVGVKTNYDPKFYSGISFMENFRVPLKTLAEEDIFSKEVIRGGEKVGALSLPMIPENTPKEIDKQSPYKGAYKYEVNNIPFPLGFAHNQYELLIAHPYHGDSRIRALILMQWLIIFIGIIIFNRQYLKNT
jgi:hypothetical protein